MKRPCIDCGSLIHCGSRCRPCIRAKERARDRPSSTERGYDARWRATSQRLIRQSPPVCVDCGRTWMVDVDGRTWMVDVDGQLIDNPPSTDHTVAKAKGGTDDPSNLRAPVCRACNSAKRDRPLSVTG